MIALHKYCRAMAGVMLAAALACLGGPGAVVAEAKRNVNFDIPAQSMATALLRFSEQSGIQVTSRGPVLQVLNTAGVHGDYRASEALEILLKGSGLTYKFVDAETVVVRELTRESASSDSQEAQTGSLRLAEGQADSIQSAPEKTATAPDSSGGGVEEIIVTAQKRSERLQDVPVPVTSISAQTLVDTHQLRLQDFYQKVPGLSLTTGNLDGSPTLVIRGIHSGGGDPTVGIMVDDVPYGSSKTFFGGSLAPDFDPSDLDRIEVLRGPQGTLYGAGSVGGLLKFVTVDPSTERTGGRVQVDGNWVDGGDGGGYGVRGAFNLPLSAELAVRASAFTRSDPGYIENVLTGQSGVNQTKTRGGRLSALWRPSDSFSIKLGALIQDGEADGSFAVNVGPGLAELQQDTVAGGGGYDRRFEVYSLTLNAKLSEVDLISVSGYSINTNAYRFDLTPFLGPLTSAFFGVSGTPTPQTLDTDKFTQEIRASIPIGEKIEWLVGGFYAHEESRNVQIVEAADPVTGTVVGTWIAFGAHSRPVTFRELAAFTNLTYHFTDRFDVQIGGRMSAIKQTTRGGIASEGIFNTLLGAPFTVMGSASESKDDAFTYLFTPRFKVSPNLMVYARLASGYRSGGGSSKPSPSDLCVVTPFPCEFEPDPTHNYEMGVKATFLDNMLSFDGSLYHIDWKDIQLPSISPQGFGYTANGGRAKSQGVDLAIESQPLTGLVLSAWVSWNDASLTEATPPTSTLYGRSGDRLPFSSRFSGTLSLEQTFPLAHGVSGFAGGSFSYVGDRKGVFTGTSLREEFPSYTKADLHLGVMYESWRATVFINNLADERGILQGGVGSIFPTTYFQIQPRTVGLSLTKNF